MLTGFKLGIVAYTQAVHFMFAQL